MRTYTKALLLAPCILILTGCTAPETREQKAKRTYLYPAQPKYPTRAGTAADRLVQLNKTTLSSKPRV